jgi:hypothetical protein
MSDMLQEARDYFARQKEEKMKYQNPANSGVDKRENPKDNNSAFGRQIAGNHYSKLKIQPMEYNLANKLNYGQANAIKYVTRYKDKNGIEDLKKAIHCIQLLIEFEESNESI